MNQQSMHRRTVKKGVENDAVSRYWRRYMCFLQRAGASAYWKNQLNRRERRTARSSNRQWMG
jgi:hypothetical protein